MPTRPKTTLREKDGEFQNSRYHWYKEECRATIDARERASRDYDRLLAVLASGALGISMTFVKDIAPQGVCKVLLGLAWIFLGLALSLLLGSLIASQKAHYLHESILLRTYEKNSDYPPPGKNCWTIATRWLNVLSMVSFFVGAILLGVFCIVNL